MKKLMNLIILLAILAVSSGCAFFEEKENPLIGTWKADKYTATYTFYEDKTFSHYAKYTDGTEGTYSGKYSYTDSILRLIFDEWPDEIYTHEYSITDNTLTILFDDISITFSLL